MKQVILDTSFILSCIKNKIDFLEEISFMGFEAVVPIQVIKELEGLKSELALKLLRANKTKTTDLKSKNVDKGLVEYSKKNPEVIIATLDKELKKKIKNQKLVIRGKKTLEII